MNLIKTKANVWDAEDTVLVDTILDLVDVVKLSGMIQVKGHTTVGDGGQGMFTFHDTLSHAYANGGTIIKSLKSDTINSASEPTGCWARLYSPDKYSLSFFGVDHSTTAHLKKEYGVRDALVSICDAEGVITSYKFDPDDTVSGKGNFNGWKLQQSTSSGSMVWQNEWAQAEYEKDDVVIDGDWTMVANKDTSERAAPQLIGAPAYQYLDKAIFDSAVESVTARQVIFGTRLTPQDRGYMGGVRVRAHIGQVYSLYLVRPADESYVELASFTAAATGWHTFNIDVAAMAPGEIIDVVAMIHAGNPALLTTTSSYNYRTVEGEVSPSVGEILQSQSDPTKLLVHTTDANSKAMSVFLAALSPGDIIEGAGAKWRVQRTTNFTSYYEIDILPAVFAKPTTGATFTFSQVTPSAITYDRLLDEWIGDSTHEGFFAQDTAYDGGVSNTNGYPMDAKVQFSVASDDWDLLAVSNVAVDGGAGGFIAHLLGNHDDVNVVAPKGGDVLTWNDNVKEWKAVVPTSVSAVVFDYFWESAVTPAPPTGFISGNTSAHASISVIYVNEADASGTVNTGTCRSLKKDDVITLTATTGGAVLKFKVKAPSVLVGSVYNVQVSTTVTGSMLATSVAAEFDVISIAYSTAEITEMKDDIDDHSKLGIANISSAHGATSANAASAIVKRDTSGGFSAKHVLVENLTGSSNGKAAVNKNQLSQLVHLAGTETITGRKKFTDPIDSAVTGGLAAMLLSNGGSTKASMRYLGANRHTSDSAVIFESAGSILVEASSFYATASTTGLSGAHLTRKDWVETQLAKKGDTTYIDQKLAAKADTVWTQARLDLKSSTIYTDNENDKQNTVIATKAVKTAVDSKNSLQDIETGKKAYTSTMNTINAAQNVDINTRAKSSDVNSKNSSQDSAINLRALITDVDSVNAAQNAVINTKASTTYVNTKNTTQDGVINTKANSNTVVNLSDNQTVAGLKTFSTNPRSSSAQSTAASALVRVDYLNTKLAPKADSNTVVPDTGNTSIGGIKTFTSNPISSGTQSTNSKALTRRDFVLAEDVKLSNRINLKGDKTHIASEDTRILAEAKSYSDSKDNAQNTVINSKAAKTHVASEDTRILAEAKAHSDSRDTSQNATIALKDTITAVNSKVATSLSSAKSYTDTTLAAALEEALSGKLLASEPVEPV